MSTSLQEKLQEQLGAHLIPGDAPTVAVQVADTTTTISFIDRDMGGEPYAVLQRFPISVFGSAPLAILPLYRKELDCLQALCSVALVVCQEGYSEQLREAAQTKGVYVASLDGTPTKVALLSLVEPHNLLTIAAKVQIYSSSDVQTTLALMARGAVAQDRPGTDEFISLVSLSKEGVERLEQALGLFLDHIQEKQEQQ